MTVVEILARVVTISANTSHGRETFGPLEFF
jgi:hypothetical protein